ncbi:MAG: DUF3810 domain-containing protein [Butyrivibrio sp.]|nr:DUF3810 domain-containing protein [Butyrivibrio sp.]
MRFKVKQFLIAIAYNVYMRKKHVSIFLMIFIFTVVLNALSWVVPRFSDIYALRVFPIITGSLGRLTSIFPFSVGEIMIIAGLLWIAFFIISMFTKIRRVIFIATLRILVIIFLVMTLNCFINYHTTPLSAGTDPGREYTIEELSAYRDEVVNKCNELSLLVKRDENNEVIFADGTGDDRDEVIESKAREAVSKLSSRYERLSGYYVTPKPLFFSGFVSQQHMQGYYFPFSMEANYNDVMHVLNKPFTMCHELAHTKSYIFEDEANFIGYLACVSSDDIAFNYSGYLGILNYVNNAFYENVSKDEYLSHVAISDQVKEDNVFLTEESWEKVEDNALFDTKTVKNAAETFVDTTLKVNGVGDGKASYNRVVELLLDEYYGGF